jgi:hypothetical protein
MRTTSFPLCELPCLSTSTHVSSATPSRALSAALPSKIALNNNNMNLESKEIKGLPGREPRQPKSNSSSSKSHLWLQGTVPQGFWGDPVNQREYMVLLFSNFFCLFASPLCFKSLSAPCYFLFALNICGLGLAWREIKL